jgi:hypothetical protein
LLKSATTAKIGEAFSDEAASAAANRLRGRLQQATLYAGVPADALIDLAVVATNKVKNGVKDFTEFSSAKWSMRRWSKSCSAKAKSERTP